MDKKIDLIPAEVLFNNQSFRFMLTHDVVNAGLPAPIHYYAMHGVQFRNKAAGINFRPVVDSWWAAMHEIGGPDADDYQHRVWAEIYPLVNTARALQDVYLDAYLSDKIDRSYSLPDDEVQRLRQRVFSGDLSCVQVELEDVLRGKRPTNAEQEQHDASASEWIDRGMVALRNKGQRGLTHWLESLKGEIAKRRKRGGEDLARSFINLFSNEAKVSMHLCYANAWVKLMPWLKQHRKIDLYSERLMYLFHTLNRNTQNPDLPEDTRRGTLYGQVLSLHPISRFLLAQRDHMAILGKWVSLPDYDRISGTKEQLTCPEYLNVLVTILCAAHEYKWAREDYENRRGKATWSVGIGADGDDSPDMLASQRKDNAPLSLRTMFEDYAKDAKITCPICGKPALPVTDQQLVADDVGRAQVTFTCEQKHPPFTITISKDQLQQHIGQSSEDDND